MDDTVAVVWAAAAVVWAAVVAVVWAAAVDGVSPAAAVECAAVTACLGLDQALDLLLHRCMWLCECLLEVLLWML